MTNLSGLSCGAIPEAGGPPGITAGESTKTDSVAGASFEGTIEGRVPPSDRKRARGRGKKREGGREGGREGREREREKEGGEAACLPPMAGLCGQEVWFLL